MRAFSGWYAQSTNYEGCTNTVPKMIKCKLLIILYKVLRLVRFGTLWYAQWYGARLSVPYVPFFFRKNGTGVKLARWYTWSLANG